MKTDKKRMNLYQIEDNVRKEEEIREQYVGEMKKIKADEQLKRRIMTKADSAGANKTRPFVAASVLVTVLCIAMVSFVLMTGRKADSINSQKDAVQNEKKKFSEDYTLVEDMENDLIMVSGRLFFDRGTDNFCVYKKGELKITEQQYRETTFAYGGKSWTIPYYWCKYDEDIFMVSDNSVQKQKSGDDWLDIQKNGTNYYAYFYTGYMQEQGFSVIYPLLFDVESGETEDIFSQYKINGIRIQEYPYYSVKVINDTFANVYVAENYLEGKNYIINMKNGNIEENKESELSRLQGGNLSDGKYDFVSKGVLDENQNAADIYLKNLNTNESILFKQEKDNITFINSLCTDKSGQNLLASYDNRISVINLDTMTAVEYETDYQTKYFNIKKAAWSGDEIFLYIYRCQQDDYIISVYKRSMKADNNTPDAAGILVKETELNEEYTKTGEVRYDEEKMYYVGDNIFFDYDNNTFCAYENGNYENIQTEYKELELTYGDVRNTVRYYYCRYDGKWQFYQVFGGEEDERSMIIRHENTNSSKAYLYVYSNNVNHEGSLKNYPLSFDLETGEYTDYLSGVKIGGTYIKDYFYLDNWVINENYVYVSAGQNETGRTDVREEEIDVRNYVLNLMNGSTEEITSDRQLDIKVYNQKDAKEEYEIIVKNGLLYLKDEKGGNLFRRKQEGGYVVCVNKEGGDKFNTYQAVCEYEDKIAVLDLSTMIMTVYDTEIDFQGGEISKVSWYGNETIAIGLTDGRVLFYE